MDRIKSKIQNHQIILEKYIRDLANEYNTSLGSDGNYHAIIDLQTNHFQFAHIGWHNKEFSYYILFHLSIHPATGNIWILKNITEIELDLELEKVGNIPKHNLVLGDFPEIMREHSDYAVA